MVFTSKTKTGAAAASTAALLAVLALGVAAPASAETNAFDGEWHFSVTPYLWLPGITGSLSFDGPIGNARGVSADINPNNYLSHLEFAAMITGELRKGDWSVFTDYIYLKFANQNSSVRDVTGPFGNVSAAVDIGSSATVKGNVWTLAGGYSVWRGDAGHLDLFAGTRYLGLDTALDWNLAGSLGLLPGRQGGVAASRDVWDGIVGVKGEIRLGDDGKWFMPYYLDVGTGSHNTTWQALLGAGYRFGWGSVTLAVRNLSYNFSGGDHDADIRFTGPALGATFVF